MTIIYKYLQILNKSQHTPRMTHWSRDIALSAAAGEGEASPSNPLGWAVGKGDFGLVY